MGDFKRGDIITGRYGVTRYAITNSNAHMIVADTNEECSEMIVVVANSNDLSVYDVANKSEYFVKETYSELVSHIKKDNPLYGLPLSNETNIGEFVFNRYSESVDRIKVIKKGEQMDIKIFDKGKRITLDEEEIDAVTEQVKKLLDKYHDADDESYQYDNYQVKRFVRYVFEAKSWIEMGFSKHPNYDRTTHTVRFDADFERKPDQYTVNNFVGYLERLMTEKMYEEFILDPPYSVEKYREIKEEFLYCGDILSAFAKLPRSVKYKTKISDTYDFKYYSQLMQDLTEKFNKYNEYCSSTELCNGCEYFRIVPEAENIWNNFIKFRNKLMKCTNRINEEDAYYINNICGYYDFIRAVDGQRTTTIVKKFAKHFGFDKHKDIRTDEFITQNGEVKTRQTDYGWNKQFAKFCDAITPKKKKMTVVISVNPLDYLTMSFGHRWASCQTIDKTNIRQNGSDNYEGMYSAGVIDLALDDATVVMYLIDPEENDDTPSLKDKIKRCLFYFEEDKFVQSRVYPDGRDGESSTDFTDMSGQLRRIMEDVISTCNKELGEWNENIKGSGFSVRDTIERDGNALHYADYNSYQDIWLVKNTKVFNTSRKIHVGHTPFCLCCGETNDYEKSIICGNCGVDDEDYCSCEHCGRRQRYDNMLYVEDGHYFCDEECAIHEGYRYCEDLDEYLYIDDCYYDEYSGNYYSMTDDEMIIAEDGTRFHGYESAENANYLETSNGAWYPAEEVHFCEECETWVHEDDWDEEHEMCYECYERLCNENEDAA